MLDALQSQLHFVRAIHEVDTTGVDPLTAIRDETREGQAEMTLGMEQLQGILDAEEKVGKHQRPRQRWTGKGGSNAELEGIWNPLQTAGWTEGGYVVVKTGRKPE